MGTGWIVAFSIGGFVVGALLIFCLVNRRGGLNTDANLVAGPGIPLNATQYVA
ncbi:Protein CBG27302 [Caenorhabditis briggsae]|uniref:Protein CBG27302 n=1 Tax=Caenorhabditis briggsae TaxID=6238 RepID=B6IM79_CAEBR|nr:Protein CBG27302 [Caenorhabditis briggsae]CAS01009.1 Protein CBG27302 [Caenorhabditis briggsae]